MKILGIDVGFALTGYGIVERVNNKVTYLAHGTIETPKGLGDSIRLEMLFDQLDKLLEKEKPDLVGVEKLFFHRNATTIITVGEARGVILLAIQKHFLDYVEITPLQVKQFISTYGRADKKQVQSMVKLLLGLDFIPKPDDAADALAIAICSSYLTRYDNSHKG